MGKTKTQFVVLTLGMPTSVRTIFVIVLYFAASDSGFAGQAKNEFGVWIAVPAGTSTLIGKTERVSLSLVAMRYSRVLLHQPAFQLRYTVDALPLVQLRYADSTVDRTAEGVGLAPLGLEIALRPGRRVEPNIGLSGGLLYFDQEVPQTGRRLNFSADSSIGLRVHLGRSVGVRIGYKYHHFSNASRAPSNPGFDSHLITFGLSILH